MYTFPYTGIIVFYMLLYETMKHIYTQAQCIISVLWEYKDTILIYISISGNLNSVEK